MLKFYEGITNFTGPPSLIKNKWSLNLQDLHLHSLYEKANF